MLYTVSGLENDHPIRDMLLNLLPAEIPERAETVEEGQDALGVQVDDLGTEVRIRACCQRGEHQQCVERTAPVTDDEQETKRAVTHAVKRTVYEAIVPFLDYVPEWGSLTGVRPAKFARGFLEKGYSPAEVARIMTENYCVSPARRALAIRSAGIAWDRKKKLQPKDISLYVGIPFCPSRCSYCSFVSHSIERAGALLGPYLDTLCAEIRHAGEVVRQAGLRIVSVYVGGGTPTTLSAPQLERLLGKIHTAFDLSAISEFTVEAGRPDTITEEKLRVLAQNGVDRISINPQSMNDDVLAAIGRKHSAKDVLNTYQTARKIGFRVINMDTIAGLDGDTPESFAETMRTLVSLKPENITVHTLAVKRGANHNDRIQAVSRHETVRKMLEASTQILTAAGYSPYYLYRQKFMAGGYENVGWTRQGFECDYNIYMMEELQTILSLGAGGVTKLLTSDGSKIRRISNPKYPYEYNTSLEKINAGKQALLEWANTL